MTMPRWASRAALLISHISAHQLHDLAAEDIVGDCLYNAMAGLSPTQSYAVAWDQAYGAGAWSRNDWVYLIDGAVESRNIDEMLTLPKR